MKEKPDRSAGRISGKYVGFVDQRGVDAALDRLALAQHCVFALRQIVALGLSKDAVGARAAKGALHRIHHGVYSLVPEPLLSRNGRYMAAVLACGPGAALSHHAAGHHRSLIISNRARIDVTVPTRGGRARKGIQIHRSSNLRPEDVELVDGIPTTTVARTIFDLAESLPQRRVERMLDQAVMNEVFDLIALDEQLTRNGARARAVSRLSRALKDHRPGSTPTDNEFGEQLLALTRSLGLPDPETQQWLDLGDGEPLIKPDFMWRRWGIILETDGHRWHGTRSSFESDRERDQRAIAAGWTPVRITWRQLTEKPGPLGARLLAAVRARSEAESVKPAA